MDRLSENAIEIVDELHTERLDYNREYTPLRDALDKLAAYEDTGLEPEEIETVMALAGKMNVIDLVRENLRLANELMHTNIALKTAKD